MNFTQLDKSNYLKGLLIIARKDNQLAESEKNMLKSIAIKLGFAEDFYEETIKNLLVNEHISEEPIKFSNSKIAFSFVSDGLRLAHSDQKIHQVEIQWLRKTAVINNIDETKFEQLIESNKEATDKKSHSEYALFSII